MKKLIAAFSLLATWATAVYAEDFKVTSSDFVPSLPIPSKHVFKGFGCSGMNISPQLSWSGEPEGTKSFAVTMYDPDAPTGSGWWHWVVFNIPATAHNLDQGAGVQGSHMLPGNAVQSRTDFGATGYGGPCPPEGHGDHRYIITVHALDVEKLDLNKDSSGALVGYMLNEHGIGKASLTAKYGR